MVEGSGATRAWLNAGPGKWNDHGYIASGSSAWTGGQVRFADVGGDARADYLVLADTGALAAYHNVTGAEGRIDWVGQGVIATGTGAPGSSVRI